MPAYSNLVLFSGDSGGASSSSKSLPSEFVYLSDVDSTIMVNARYFGSNNFLGRRVSGYVSPHLVCTKAAGKALHLASSIVAKMGYQLVVYDAYRPQRAVNEFIAWSNDASDDIAKPFYYPNINKKDLFDLHYIAAKSGHTRGSTFDLTLIKMGQSVCTIRVGQRTLKSGETIPFLDDGTLDMGSSFDLFHTVSHDGSPLIRSHEQANRLILRNAMTQAGFTISPQEWWHFTLQKEPFPDTYFDFVVQF
jgi:D-alanyl-D-alanine dipeptidase